MRALMLIAVAGLAASCSQPATPPGEGFAQVTAGRVAGPAKTCISNYPAQNIHVIDAQTLAYGYGKTIYINRFDSPCPAMAELNTIIVEASTGNEYCRGDRVRGLEPGAIIAGPSCNLGDWTPYTQP